MGNAKLQNNTTTVKIASRQNPTVVMKENPAHNVLTAFNVTLQGVKRRAIAEVAGTLKWEGVWMARQDQR
jgi:hypothetical protein